MELREYKQVEPMENFTDVKLEIFLPQEYALKICDELAKISVGQFGKLISSLCSQITNP